LSALCKKRECAVKISNRSATLGAAISISRSKRPGRRSAGSNRSAWLVSATTVTAPLCSACMLDALSSSVKICATTRFDEPPPLLRIAQMASMRSSTRITETPLAARASASANASRSRLSLSPA
jgi:hypothetical protein